jgi:hypothetical protein
MKSALLPEAGPLRDPRRAGGKGNPWMLFSLIEVGKEEVPLVVKEGALAD